MKITIIGVQGAAKSALVKRLAWFDKKRLKRVSAINSNAGKRQAYSMSTLHKVCQFGKVVMLSALLSILTLPAQAMTVLTLDGAVHSAYTLDGIRQLDSDLIYTESSQSHLALITITFDETLIKSDGSYVFSLANNPVSEFDISMNIFGQTFSRGTDIDTNYIEPPSNSFSDNNDPLGSPYFLIRNYHTPGETELSLEWVISEIDLPEGFPVLVDGTLGDNYTEIVRPDILSIILSGHGDFQQNNATIETGNLYNVGLELVVVPVPATAWLFATALAGLAGVSSRRQLK